MTDKELFELVDELKETNYPYDKSMIKNRILHGLAGTLNKYVVTQEYHETFMKWCRGITLKEFKEEIERLGLTIEEDKYNIVWHIKYKGCLVATIDPVNECMMQTSKLFYKLDFKFELFELLTGLAFTSKENRHLEDFFEEDEII